MTLWLLWTLQAFAGTLADVTLPDTATVGGQALVLNGLGLREKMYFDIYVGGLYLPAKTTDSAKAVSEDVAKRIVMQFIYSGGVPKDKMNETFDESFGKQGAAGVAQESNKNTLKGWMDDMAPGDQVVLDYVPGTGTTVTVKGTRKGTIPGADFMRVLWSVYVGPNPPTAALKNGMMSGK
ncbi:MAG: chalcone isomerase family protein [Deltaproteobacteria bacterium]|nr:chalcone isomerase family protein [Deltaproteobacteria bacterium]